MVTVLCPLSSTWGMEGWWWGGGGGGGGDDRAEGQQLWQYGMKLFFLLSWCFMSTETVQLIRDGEKGGIGYL